MNDKDLKRKIRAEIANLGSFTPDMARQYFLDLQDKTGDRASPFRGRIASIVREHKTGPSDRDWIGALRTLHAECADDMEAA